MEAVAEGLWLLAENFERSGNVPQALKCLEAICQSTISFLPIVEVKTRLQIASLLLDHTDNLKHAKSHLERAQILLKQIPSCFELKCRAFSLLSRCYHLNDVIHQKQTLKKGLELATSVDGTSAHMWACNFNLQLANALTIEGDFSNAIRALESGLGHAAKARTPHLELVFATSMLHVHLMQSDDSVVLEQTLNRCDQLWNEISQENLPLGLHVYNELLHVFYFLRLCDYKVASYHVELLDNALANTYSEPEHLPDEEKRDRQLQLQLQQSNLRKRMEWIQEQLNHTELSEEKKRELFVNYQGFEQQLQDLAYQLASLDSMEASRKIIVDPRLPLGPFPLGGEWLPTGAVLILADLMAIACARPKGIFKDYTKRLNSGLALVKDELYKLGISATTKEQHLPGWTIYTAGLHLMLLIHLLENKFVIELTRTELVDAQETLLQLLELCSRFPTMLLNCGSTVHVLLGHYAHSVGCFREAALHFVAGARATESKAAQAMSHVYAAISLICMGDPDSCSQALDLIGPVHKAMDSFVGVREKAVVLFASGLLQMKQNSPQEARTRLSSGLKLTHKQLGNHQLVSQYLTVLGSLALAMHDTGQARDILKSSFILAKALHDVPAQIGVLSALTALYRELGDADKADEYLDYEQRKIEELRTLIDVAVSSNNHHLLLKYGLPN